MIAVIFEEWPQDEHYQRHLDLAAELKPQLEELDGFISVERYQSLTEPRKILRTPSRSGAAIYADLGRRALGAQPCTPAAPKSGEARGYAAPNVTTP